MALLKNDRVYIDLFFEYSKNHTSSFFCRLAICDTIFVDILQQLSRIVYLYIENINIIKPFACAGH